MMVLRSVVGRRMRPLRCYLAASAVLMSLPDPARAEQPAAEFLPEAKAAWRTYQDFSRRLQGTTKFTFYEFEGGRHVISASEGGFKQRAPYLLNWWVNTEDHRAYNEDARRKAIAGNAFVAGEKGSFRLTRKEPDSPWVLTSYSPDCSPEPLRPFDLRKMVEHGTQSGLDVFGAYLPGLVDDEGFSFTAGSKETVEGEELVRLNFRHQPQEGQRGYSFREGWVRLDPKRSWLIREYDFAGTMPEPRLNVTVDYVDGPSGFALARRVHRLWYKTEQGKRVPTSEAELEYELREQESVPAKEFTLTAFGLPEVTRPNPGGAAWWRLPAYLYFVGLGIGSLGIAGLLRWRAARSPA